MEAIVPDSMRLFVPLFAKESFITKMNLSASSKLRVVAASNDPASPFEMPVTAKTLAQLEVALSQAKATDERVVLLTNGTTPQALIAGFVRWKPV